MAKFSSWREIRSTLSPRDSCARRGNAGTQLLYDPDRLKYPLIRTGKRGEGKFRRVSWDEALDFFATHLKDLKQKYGAESVGFFPHGVAAGFFGTLMKAYGTPNAAEPAFAQCRGPRDIGYQLTFGRAVNSPEPVDLEESKCIVLIGSHIGENVFTSQVTNFITGLQRGAKLIVVDPRFSTAASKADHWLPIKPGTDIALLLAWMNVLIAENLYDKEYSSNTPQGSRNSSSRERLQPGMGGINHRDSSRTDSRNRSHDGRGQTCRRDPSWKARHLVRR